MNGNKLEKLEEVRVYEKVKMFLDWELSNINACGSTEKMKSRLYSILSLGISLGKSESFEEEFKYHSIEELKKIKELVDLEMFKVEKMEKVNSLEKELAKTKCELYDESRNDDFCQWCNANKTKGEECDETAHYLNR